MWLKPPTPFGVWRQDDGLCRLHGEGLTPELRVARPEAEALILHAGLVAGYEHGLHTKADEFKRALGLI